MTKQWIDEFDQIIWDPDVKSLSAAINNYWYEHERRRSFSFPVLLRYVKGRINEFQDQADKVRRIAEKMAHGECKVVVESFYWYYKGKATQYMTALMFLELDDH